MTDTVALGKGSQNSESGLLPAPKRMRASSFGLGPETERLLDSVHLEMPVGLMEHR